MAEQKKGSSVFMVDQDSSNITGKPYRPNEVLEDTTSDIHQKKSKARAPNLPSVNDLKTNIEQQDALKETARLNDTDEPASDGCKSESIALVSLEVNPSKKGVAPVPSSKAKPLPDLDVVGKEETKDNQDRDSIADEIADLNAKESPDKHDWLDDEAADGLGPLPLRNESRASRISRVVRTWFCCGFIVEAPSDEDLMDDYEDEQGEAI